MLCRRSAWLVPVLFALFAILFVRCDVQLHIGYRVKLYNSGRDPIHVAGTRIAQGMTETIGFVGGEYGEDIELSMSRMDINLGKIKLTEVMTAKNRDVGVIITMTEPVYFDFQFECDKPDRVSVQYIKP
ncbi:hypothetical protein FJY70_05470 [candidate division WOR-3 bacterium]|nr:hypothetical protein [candidate division WOR-3 bacterium]